MNGSLVHILKSHIDYVYSFDLYDDQTLISGSWDQTIKLWDIEKGQLIKTINTDMKINALVMLKSGKFKYFNILLKIIQIFYFLKHNLKYSRTSVISSFN